MACSVGCSITDSVASGTCSTVNLTLPTLPDNIDVPKAPKVSDVTEEVVSGKGVFDVYMRAGMNQLDTQWEKGRIKGADYAQVYIAQMQLMMTEANKFVLGVFQAEIAAKMFDAQYMGAAYDALAKEAQAKKLKYESDLLCQQIAELKANGKVERELKKSQKQTQIKQAELYGRQITGYSEKHKNENAKMLLDAWAVQAVEEPDPAQYKILGLASPSIDPLVSKIRSGTGL